jgi:hypothetical protein
MRAAPLPGGRARHAHAAGPCTVCVQAAPVHQRPRQGAGHAGARGQRHITLDAQRFAPGRQTRARSSTRFTFAAIAGRSTTRSGVPERQVELDPREIDDISGATMTRTPATVFCAPPTGPDLRGSWEDLPDSWLDLTKAEPKVKPTYKNASRKRSGHPQGRPGRGGGVLVHSRQVPLLPWLRADARGLRQRHEPSGQPVGRRSLVGHHHAHAQRSAPTVRAGRSSSGSARPPQTAGLHRQPARRRPAGRALQRLHLPAHAALGAGCRAAKARRGADRRALGRRRLQGAGLRPHRRGTWPNT